MADKENQITTTITAREDMLLNMVRGLGFGEILIHVADGQPVRAEEIKKSVKF